MPDPRQMSGIPRPVTDLPNGAVSVRVIRGSLSNNIEGQLVELHVDSKVLTAKTDDAGRTEFDNLTPGATVKAVAVVDGERLESQEFPAPPQGGIRLLLVATDKSKSAAASAPAVTGQVGLGSRSRLILEPGEETVALYYVLEIVNSGSAPVNPTKPFIFDMPKGARGTAVLQGSSPLASASGPRVQVQGPFPPGSTLVQVGCQLPADRGSLDVTQRFPAAMDQFSVIIKKLGATRVTSAQIASQQEMTAQGDVFIVAVGRAVGADQPLSLSLTDLPHHSDAPRWAAVGLASAIVLVGVWAATRGPEDEGARAIERKRLVTRREKLLADLVRLEHDRRNGHADERRYVRRREELLAALEHVYGALDSDEGAPDPASAGVAA